MKTYGHFAGPLSERTSAGESFRAATHFFARKKRSPNDRVVLCYQCTFLGAWHLAFLSAASNHRTSNKATARPAMHFAAHYLASFGRKSKSSSGMLGYQGKEKGQKMCIPPLCGSSFQDRPVFAVSSKLFGILSLFFPAVCGAYFIFCTSNFEEFVRWLCAKGNFVHLCEKLYIPRGLARSKGRGEEQWRSLSLIGFIQTALQTRLSQWNIYTWIAFENGSTQRVPAKELLWGNRTFLRVFFVLFSFLPRENKRWQLNVGRGTKYCMTLDRGNRFQKNMTKICVANFSCSI